MRYELRKDGVTLVRRPTRLQCVIEAYERGLAVACRGAESLIDGVEIVDRGARKGRGRWKMLNWGSVARHYVEHGTAAQETFGKLPANDNVPEPARISDDPAYQEFERLANEQGEQHASPTAGAPWQKRPGEFMQTYSGRRFFPLDPRPEEIHIEDIAHALAHLCRYGGHCQAFYSVAEHSVLMSRTFTRRTTALWALMHDAAEAYIADVPRPLKKFLPGYKEAEERVMAAVCERFGLPPTMPLEVKDADNRILADEIAQNMRPMDWHSEHQDFLGVDLQFWSPDDAESEFLLRFWDLMDRRAAA